MHATGTVKVELATDGQPHFDITKDVAWDFLDWTPKLQQLAERADAVCFGSLAQRGLKSRETIQRFVDATRPEAVRIFDVNLRQAFYSTDVLTSSSQKATLLKLNHEEVPIMMKSAGGPAIDELRSAQWLCRRFGVKLVCITRGSAGSLLVSKDSHAEHPGFRVTVADTVGAGDAFTATLVHHYLRGSDLPTMNEAANRVGSWVASKPGGTPAPEPEVIRQAQAS
jgi:fructokinase